MSERFPESGFSAETIMTPKQVRNLRKTLSFHSFKPVDSILTVEGLRPKLDYEAGLEWNEDKYGNHIIISKIDNERKYNVDYSESMSTVISEIAED